LIAQLSGRADLHLLAVGDGPAREPLTQLVDELGVQDRVTITGNIERSQIPAHIAAFDIAVQTEGPSYASPRGIVEYMALGKAILAPDQPSITELVENERTALLFEKSNTEALRLGLLRLMTDKALRDRLGSAAAMEVKRRPLTWVSNADHVATALKRAIR
jgi:glycosyltransferase involved in cell wall biosynthesis